MKIIISAVFAVCLSLASLAFAATTEPALKPATVGLVTSGWADLPPANMPFIDWATVNVKWSDLEPADQDFSGPDWKKIDEARRPGKYVRVRVLCGVNSPDWVKKIGGLSISDPERKIDASKGGVAIYNLHAKRGGTIAPFWLPEYMDQYEQLMTEFARRYEDDPQITEVIDSACMTLFAEPFYRAHGNAGTNLLLWKAGLRADNDLAAHRRAMQIHDKLFKKTRTSLAINDWDIIDDSATHYHKSWKDTYEFVNWARKLMGDRLTLQNNGFYLDSDVAKIKAGDPASYHLSYLVKYPCSRGMQPRENPKTAEEMYKLANMATDAGYTFQEYSSFSRQKLDVEKLKDIDARIEENSSASASKPEK